MVKLGPNTPTRANWPSQNAQFMLTWWKTETRSGEQRFEQFGSTAAINWGSRSLKIILLNICTCGPRNFALLRFEPQASKYCYFTLYSPKKKYFLSSHFVCKFYFSTNLWSHILFVHKSMRPHFYLSTNLFYMNPHLHNPLLYARILLFLFFDTHHPQLIHLN